MAIFFFLFYINRACIICLSIRSAVFLIVIILILGISKCFINPLAVLVVEIRMPTRCEIADRFYVGIKKKFKFNYYFM